MKMEIRDGTLLFLALLLVTLFTTLAYSFWHNGSQLQAELQKVKKHDCPLAHLVKMLGYLVLIWLQHNAENFLSLPHEHHIQSLFAASCELEEFELLNAYVAKCGIV